MNQPLTRDAARDFDFSDAAFSSVELRRYRMKPGRRDDLITLFEKHFIETQEACGMVPLGHFRDIDDDDAFVWLRGFQHFERRAAALEAFYVHSDAWKTYRDAANDTMIDSDNVLLLRPPRARAGFDVAGLTRPALSAPEGKPRYLWISALMLDMPASAVTVCAFELIAAPLLRNITLCTAYFLSDQRANDFPRLPVREGENAFVICGSCETLDDLERCKRIVDAELAPSIAERLLYTEHLRLRPARRSLLR